MPQPENLPLDIVTVALYILVLWLPGGIVAALAGMRGWALAAAAPLITYAVAGLAGPWTHIAGLPYNLLTFGMTWLLFVLVLAGYRRYTRGRTVERDEPVWPPLAQLAVAACLVLATAVAMYTVLRGMGRLSAIQQDFDAAFHANGIRYIAETGDGGLFGMSRLNWYDHPPGVFYPNAYHLVGSLVYRLSGAPIPVVLNTQMLLWGGMLALSLIAVVRTFRGRAVLAGYTALVGVTVAGVLYESMARGPLLPYQTGIVLLPMIVVLLIRYLDRPGTDTGMMFAAGTIGLLCVHSSTLFGGLLLLLPVLATRWWRQGRRAVRELWLLLLVAVPSALVIAPHLLGAISVRLNSPEFSWSAGTTVNEAVGTLLTFQHPGNWPSGWTQLQPSAVVERWPRVWLAAALWIGLLRYRRLGRMRWLVGAAATLGLLYVLDACYPQRWVVTLTSPWWNDSFRLVTLAAIPLTVIAGHGLAELHHGVSTLLRRSGTLVPAVAAVLLLAMFGVLTGGFYHREDSRIVAYGYGNQPGNDIHRMTVSPQEVTAMRELGTLVRPGERVLNDRGDGSAWMYALAGVEPVAAHFEQSQIGAQPELLAARFRDYPADPAVCAVVKALRIRWVIVDTGFVHTYFDREPGLRDLDGLPFLRKVYTNSDSTIYRLVPEATNETSARNQCDTAPVSPL